MDSLFQLSFLVLFLFWFFTFWILGGVLFSVFAFRRLLRVRKARFSCAFTLLSGIAAGGVAWMNVGLLEKASWACLKMDTGLATVQRYVSCFTPDVLRVALIGFIALAVLGFILIVSLKRDRV